MTALMTTINPHSKFMENLITETVTTCPHTRRTLQAETGAAERTVRRWIKKADVTGQTINGVERFTDEQREMILSHQAPPKKSEVIEAELVEPGAITLHQGNAIEARPLISFDLAPIELNRAALDTSALDAQTQQYQQQAQNGANAIAAALSARFDMGIAQIVAEQNNLLEGIKASALNGAARSISNQQAEPGKPR